MTKWRAHEINSVLLSFASVHNQIGSCSLWSSFHRCWRFSLKNQRQSYCHGALHIGPFWIVVRRTFFPCRSHQSIQFWINNQMSHRMMLIKVNLDFAMTCFVLLPSAQWYWLICFVWKFCFWTYFYTDTRTFNA